MGFLVVSVSVFYPQVVDQPRGGEFYKNGSGVYRSSLFLIVTWARSPINEKKSFLMELL